MPFGHKDARVYLNSNLPNQCQTYFFDPANRYFRYIENTELDFEPVNKTTLYYSYHRAGCADMNWGSGLGRVEHFKWVALGLIAGEGCDTNEKKREIRIYKVSKVDSAADRLVEVLPYKKNIPEFNAKWDFIKRYWEMNWKNFVE